MAHDKGGTHAEKGITGIGKQYAHRIAHPIAHWLLNRPWFISMLTIVGTDDPKLIANVIRMVAGYFNLPGTGTLAHWINELSDMVASEVAEVLEKDPDFLKRDIGISADDIEALAQADFAEVKTVLQGNALIVLGVVHKDEECLTVSEYKTDMTSPPRTQGKKVFPGQCRARIIKTTLVNAMKEMKPLCPRCFPAGSQSVNTDGSMSAAESDDLFALVKQIAERGEVEDGLAHAFWQRFVAFDSSKQQKILKMVNSGNGLNRLSNMVGLPAEDWDVYISTFVQTEEVVKSHSILSILAGAYEVVRKKLDAEGVEIRKLIGHGETWLKASNKKLAAKIEAAKKVAEENAKTRREKKGKLRRLFSIKGIAISASAAFIIGWSVYGLVQL